MQPKQGRPFSYEPKIHLPKILKAVDEVLAFGLIADLSEVPRNTLKGWVKYGDSDREQGISSDFAHLSQMLKKGRAEKARELIKIAMKGRKNLKFIMWQLRACFPEDYGQDSELYKELLQDYKNLLQNMNAKNDIPII